MSADEEALLGERRDMADAAYAAYELGEGVSVMCGTPWTISDCGRMTRDIIVRPRFVKAAQNVELSFIVEFEAADTAELARATAVRADTGEQFGRLPDVIPELKKAKFRRGPSGVRYERLCR